MYKIEFAKSFVKDFKKTPKEVQNIVIDKWIPRLQKDPSIGQRFVGKKLKGFLKLAFRYKKNDYRIVFKVYNKEIKIVLIAIGSRENFYRHLGL